MSDIKKSSNFQHEMTKAGNINFFLGAIRQSIIDLMNIPESIISNAEKNYRRNLLLKEKGNLESGVYNPNVFWGRIHEINLFMYFISVQKPLLVSSDKSSEPGPDIISNGTYYESVCITLGKMRKKVNKFHEIKGLFDYQELLSYLLPMITQSLNNKVAQHKKNLSRFTQIESSKPYVILMNLGELYNYMFVEEFGIGLCRVLVGADIPTIRVNHTKRIVENSFFSHKDTYSKYNGSQISANFFLNPNNSIVSAVILFDASVRERYFDNPIYLYLNPYAQNPIDPEKFESTGYWYLEGNQYVFKQNQNLKIQ